MYEVSTVDLREMVKKTAADFVTLAARKEIELYFDLHSAQVQGSALMMRELFSNLLDNAVPTVRTLASVSGDICDTVPNSSHDKSRRCACIAQLKF